MFTHVGDVGTGQSENVQLIKLFNVIKCRAQILYKFLNSNYS